MADDGERLIAAIEFLQTILSRGPVEADVILATAQAEGHSWADALLAQQALCIRTFPEFPNGPWLWSLPMRKNLLD